MDGKIPVQPGDRVSSDMAPNQIEHNEANGEKEIPETAAIYVGLADLMWPQRRFYPQQLEHRTKGEVSNLFLVCHSCFQQLYFFQQQVYFWCPVPVPHRSPPA